MDRDATLRTIGYVEALMDIQSWLLSQVTIIEPESLMAITRKLVELNPQRAATNKAKEIAS